MTSSFVRGRSIYNDRGLYGESLGEVCAYFRAAIEADPSFAAPWAGMAAVELMALRAGRLPESEALARVDEALERALALDPDNTWALLTRAAYLS